jgi:hypothetical protein
LDGLGPAFPYRAPVEMGREPAMRSFELREEHVISQRDTVDHLVRSFPRSPGGRAMKVMTERVAR